MTTTEEALELAADLQGHWQHPDMHDAAALIRTLVQERDEARGRAVLAEEALTRIREFLEAPIGDQYDSEWVEALQDYDEGRKKL